MDDRERVGGGGSEGGSKGRDLKEQARKVKEAGEGGHLLKREQSRAKEG